MKLAVKTLDNKAAGDLTVSEAVFGLKPIRRDILARMVNYQLAKRQQGTHDTKQIAEISGRKAKPWKQKGTGRARQGSTRSPQWRGGATIFGPTPRSHAFDLTKKFRALALRMALSAKSAADDLVVLDDIKASSAKTKDLLSKLEKMDLTNALFIGGAELDANFVKAASNMPFTDVLPVQGANVYDILRRKKLVLSKAAVEALEARFAGKAKAAKPAKAEKAEKPAKKAAAKPAAKAKAAKTKTAKKEG